MLIYDVFGRHIGVQRRDGRWLLFRVDLNERKYSPLHGVIIPDDLTEAEIPGWLGDIFHEAASPRHPDGVAATASFCFAAPPGNRRGRQRFCRAHSSTD